MKNIITLVSVGILFLYSSSITAQLEEQATTPEKTVQTSDKTTSSIPIPSFESKKVQEYAQSYSAYIEEYIQAFVNKDQGSLSSLEVKANELSQKAPEVYEKASPEDKQKMSTYITQVTTQLQEVFEQPQEQE